MRFGRSLFLCQDPAGSDLCDLHVRGFGGSVVQKGKSRFRWFTVVSKRQVKVSVVRGNEEALQAKLDRGQEEFNGTWHSQVIDEEQAEATTVDAVALIYREGVWYES